MEISVRQINIKPKYIRTLIINGIVLVSHLNAFNVKRLTLKTKLSRDECEEILAAIKPKRPSYVMKASELMIRPFEKISTTLKDLDLALGGGIRCGQLTEISGEAGAGKSNLAAQMGTLVMMPVENGGLDGSVLMIHTEGEGKLLLTIKRYKTLAMSSFGDEEIIRKKLHVMNCSNEFELLEMVNRLNETLDKVPNVKLIIIDSITCAFIQTEGQLDYRFYTKRSLRLTKIVKALAQIAWERRLAIIATNHVSFNARLGETRPAMGKLWSHLCQTKIYLERKELGYDVTRYAYVTKGAINTPTIALYRISDRIQN
jgi:RecA/RadA recombinase